jgi:signal peptidase II
MNHRLINIGLYMAAIAAMADQFSKWWLLNEIMTQVPPGTTVRVTPFFNLVLNMNRGVTFGLFNHEQQWLSYAFAGTAALVLIFLFRWLMRSTSLLAALGLGLVMGGAIGNVIDRLRYGAVVDFLDFHVAGYHWYAFNLADSAIVCGVGLLLIENLVTGAKKR